MITTLFEYVQFCFYMICLKKKIRIKRYPRACGKRKNAFGSKDNYTIDHMKKKVEIKSDLSYVLALFIS